MLTYEILGGGIRLSNESTGKGVGWIYRIPGDEVRPATWELHMFREGDTAHRFRSLDAAKYRALSVELEAAEANRHG